MNQQTTTESPNSRVRAVIKGRVQGVGFRNWAYSQARLLKVTGWVRNLEHGEVEVVAQGEESVLKTLVDELRTGPKLAKVTAVEAEWSSGDPSEFKEFRIQKN